jgi:hypothetical protein
VDPVSNKVYTYNGNRVTYATADSACSSSQPVAGAQLQGTLWVVNGYSENQRVEWYFRQQNASLQSYWCAVLMCSHEGCKLMPCEAPDLQWPLYRLLQTCTAHAAGACILLTCCASLPSSSASAYSPIHAPSQRCKNQQHHD